MTNLQDETCPKCNKQLTGAIETVSATVGGIQFVVMHETGDRNWIICDRCNTTVCKSCCVVPEAGYCNRCFFDYKIAPFLS